MITDDLSNVMASASIPVFYTANNEKLWFYQESCVSA